MNQLFQVHLISFLCSLGRYSLRTFSTNVSYDQKYIYLVILLISVFCISTEPQRSGKCIQSGCRHIGGGGLVVRSSANVVILELLRILLKTSENLS